MELFQSDAKLSCLLLFMVRILFAALIGVDAVKGFYFNNN